MKRSLDARIIKNACMHGRWVRGAIAVAIMDTGLLGTAYAQELTAGDASFAAPLVYKLGDVTVTTKGTATFGTVIRADARNPEFITPGNGKRVGIDGRAVGGQNEDDGNLNYARGDRAFTVLKAVIDVDLKYQNFGAFVRAKAWTDFTLENDDVPHGNLPNGYVANTPLSDSGFSRLGKFSGIELKDANVYASFDLGQQKLFVRGGYQNIGWGTPATVLGGLEQIDPIDNPARVRPGAVPEETRIAIPAVFARFGPVVEDLNVEGFYQFGFRPNELPGCGTFASFADYVTDGCNGVVIGNTAAFSDPELIASGFLVKRAPDVDPSNTGQYGVGVTYLAKNLGLFGLYYANYHSRRLAVSVIKSSRPAGSAPFIPGDPDGKNAQYFIEYPEDVHVWGLTFRTRLPDQTGFFAEYVYRPNETIQLATSDLLGAFASNTAPTLLRADATATPPGGDYHGTDRHKMSQLSFGASKPFGTVLGGDFTLSGEVGIKYIHDLPDVNVRRYTRRDVFGLGPVNGVCVPGASAKQCSSDGYASSSSWGYRLKASSRYIDVLSSVFGGVNLTPSVTFIRDVKGWSYDYQFIEGRQVAIVALRADWRKNFYVEAQWTPISGGDYNFTKDRDFYSLFVGATF